jgi:hypothetical protein
MARLRNRIRKAEYFTDGELLHWHRDKRQTYTGLWALAEDSGCLEDDPFGWKLQLWPSPLDADITVELLAQWRDELIEADKLVPYEADGKRYFYLRTFHKHEQPRNPQRADLPLPPWVLMEPIEGTAKDGKRWLRVQYRVLDDLLPPLYRHSTDSVQNQNGVSTDSVQAPPCTSSPVPSRPVPYKTIAKAIAESAPEESTCDLITLPSSIRDDQELWPLLETVLGRSAGALFNGKAKARSHAGTIRRLLADVCGFCSDLTSGITCERRAGWCRACALETLTRVAAADESIPFAQSLFTSAHELGDYCGEALAEQYRVVNSENPVAAGIAALAETMKPPVGMSGYPIVEGPDG